MPLPRERRTDMTITTACACGQKYSFSELHVGLSARCVKCGATFLISPVASKVDQSEPSPPKPSVAEEPVDDRGDDEADDPVPTKSKSSRSRRRREREEAKRRQRLQIIIGAAAAFGLIFVCVFLIILFRSSSAGPQVSGAQKGGTKNAGKQVNGGQDGANPGGSPGGFVTVDALEAEPKTNSDVAKRKEQRQRIKKVADQAPPFDSGQSLTMRSTFGQLALRGGV